MVSLEFRANSNRILLENLINVFPLHFHLLGGNQNSDERIFIKVKKVR